MKIIKKLFYSILKRSSVFRNITRYFINPTKLFMQNANFKGAFKVPNNDKKTYYLYNNKFYLENNIYWKGIDSFDWELTARKIWIELSKNSDVIFDIGANTGIYAITAKVYNKKSTIYAFEPQPNIFDVLQKNINLNEYDIIGEEIALSNKTGNLPFYNYGSPQTFLDSNTTAGSLNKDWRSHKINHQSIIVPVIKIEDYIKNNNITKIDLMKIDVETYEYQVLDGMGKYLNQFRPIIIIEIINPVLGLEINSLFENLNYIYLNICESKGVVDVKTLGENSDCNYILCPIEKKYIIENIN